MSEFYNKEDNSLDFIIVKADSLDFKLILNGFEWFNDLTPNEYNEKGKNADLDIAFSISKRPSILIKNFNIKVYGIIKKDTIKLKNGLINIDLSGTSNISDLSKNQKLSFFQNNYELQDKIPVDSGFYNYYFPQNRCSYCYDLFRITYNDSLIVDFNDYIISLKIDFVSNSKDYSIRKDFKLLRKIKKRKEFIH